MRIMGRVIGTWWLNVVARCIKIHAAWGHAMNAASDLTCLCFRWQDAICLPVAWGCLPGCAGSSNDVQQTSLMTRLELVEQQGELLFHGKMLRCAAMFFQTAKQGSSNSRRKQEAFNCLGSTATTHCCSQLLWRLQIWWAVGNIASATFGKDHSEFWCVVCVETTQGQSLEALRLTSSNLLTRTSAFIHTCRRLLELEANCCCCQTRPPD